MADRHVVQQLLDRVAVSASALCLLHCLATPLLLVALPVLSSTLLADEALHRMLVLCLVPVSIVALFLGCRAHRDRGVLALGALGLGALVVVAYAGQALVGEVGERAGTAVAGGILAAGHVRNFRLCRRDHCGG